MTEPFRTAETQEAPKADVKTQKKAEPVSTQAPLEVEPSFSVYRQTKGKPYLADYYKLPHWNHPDLGYKPEIDQVESYIQNEIDKGKLDSSLKSVEGFLGKLEKQANIQPYEGSNRRLTRLAAFAKFLLETSYLDEVIDKSR